MRNTRLSFLLLLSFFVLWGCSSEQNTPPRGSTSSRFYATPSSLTFDAAETVLQLAISTDAHWKITCDAAWLNAVPAEGVGSTKVRVSAQANPLTQVRTASLSIEYGDTAPAVIPITQKIESQEPVTLFGSTEEMKSFLKSRIIACDYAESVTEVGGVLKFGFKGAPTRGVRKAAIPFFTVGANHHWMADKAATPVEADAAALRGGAVPAVTLTASGKIAFDGVDTGVDAPQSGAVALRCVVHTGKYLCFAFSDEEMLWIGSELNGGFNPPLPVGTQSLSILFIGNSFTVDATEHLPGMLKSAGITNVRMARAYHGGYKLPEFFENYAAPDICTYYFCQAGATKWENDGVLNRSLRSIIESDEWDIVTIQEHTGSKYAWEWSTTAQDAIFGLCDKIQQAQPLHRPTICYIMAQAYGRSNTYIYPKYFTSQQAMFEAITAQVEKITTKSCIDIVIPSGTALQNLRTTSLNKNNGMDLTRDSYHMDFGISRYAAAATVFQTLITPFTQQSVEANTYRYSNSSTSTTAYSTPVTDANAPIAITAALEACRTPYAVTDMSKY